MDSDDGFAVLLLAGLLVIFAAGVVVGALFPELVWFFLSV